MTTNELQKRYASLIMENCYSGDTEMDHVRRDQYVSAFLRDAGFNDLADASDEAEAVNGFWYA